MPDHSQKPDAHGGSHGHAEEHEHPTWGTYKYIAIILTVITVIEVWVYYIPAFVATKAFIPTLLIMSAVKFAIVVLFYMHLKYDHKLFRALFTGDRKSTRLNSSHIQKSRMPSSA